jgi:cytochrome c oxidase assembly protein subunit 11
MMGISTAAVAFSPQIYRMFCAATGYNGTVRRALAPPGGSAAGAARRFITVRFDSNVARNLPWSFRPELRTIRVPLGQPTKVYYDARNNSARTIVARAVYNVTPFEIAPFFFKIQCFCFTNEKLGPGESARMPLVFYVDEQAGADANARDVQEATLSYTFYPQTDLSSKQVIETRDLAVGSKQEDKGLNLRDSAVFSKDVKPE